MRSDIPFNLRCIPSALLFLCIGSFSMFADLCPSCKQSYPDFTRLAVHCALEHKLWLCPNCQETFRVEDKKAYWRHRTKAHGEAVCFACNLRAFRNKTEWKRHRTKHKEKDDSLLSTNGAPCCPQAPVHLRGHWVRKLHMAHFHGSWLDFFVTVRVLSDCCEPFREAILTHYPDYLKSDWSDDVREKFLKGIRNFSKHVCKVHGLCFFCESKLGDTDMFDHQTIYTDFFLQPRKNMFSLKTGSFPCFCGQCVQRNAESQLFVLKIDRLPFGTGLDTVTHPFYCIIDDGKNEKKDHSEREKAGNAVSPKSDASIRKDSEEPKENSHKAPPSPSLSTKSGDTTLTSIDDKKHKKVPEVDAHTVLLTGNETGKASENL